MKEAEQGERMAARQWQSTFDAIADGVALLDAQGIVLRTNRALAAIAGRADAELIGRFWFDLFPTEDWESPPQAMLGSLKRGVREHLHNGKLLRFSRDPILRVTGAETGAPMGFVVLVRDITEPRRLQEMLRKSQKLEGIGLLAVGVAHDFSNLLTGILGNASLALESAPADIADHLRQVMQAGELAAGLARQLLVYAGKGKCVTRSTDVAELVRDLIPLIRANIPREVEIVLDLEPEVPPVEGDAAQLLQVVMNLVINGAEAVGKAGGTVRVHVHSKHLEGADVRLRYYAADRVESGQFVAIQVSDTGCGMDEATQSRIFDPFFTTKLLGRGLGLAAALGIVRQHRGGIRVESAPGRGTTFEVVIPASVAGLGETPEGAVSSLPAMPCGVLVIDDEAIVRTVIQAVLERSGYRLTVAENGRQGVELFARSPDEFSIVLLDLSMPVMGAEEALGLLLRLRPNAKVLIVSGYDESEVIRLFGHRHIAGFLQKPFTAGRLLQKVREVLVEDTDFSVLRV
jgi:PAS domain S-box-containing protein